MTRSLQLSPVADLSPFLTKGELVALSIGPDSQIYVVIALEKPDYRFIDSRGSSFAKALPEKPQTYRVVVLYEGDATHDVTIVNERYNISDVQPLPNDEILLVCARSVFTGPGKLDRNGRVYDRDGQFVREILLGDGIESVQATSAGVIWTSFFDEGVLGNRGWPEPVGASGLVAWDPHGQQLYEYQPTGLDPILSCYALNVASDSSTWLYYNPGFPLVHLRDRRIDSHWQIPVRGSHAFAVSGGLALISGGYEERDVYHLFDLGHKGEVTEVSQLKLLDESGEPLLAEWVLGRSDTLYLLHRNQIYRCHIAQAARSR